jgi:hypothetical protein
MLVTYYDIFVELLSEFLDSGGIIYPRVSHEVINVTSLRDVVNGSPQTAEI